MKCLIVLSALLAFAAAKPGLLAPALSYSSYPWASLGYSSLYHPSAYSSVVASPALVSPTAYSSVVASQAVVAPSAYSSVVASPAVVAPTAYSSVVASPAVVAPTAYSSVVASPAVVASAPVAVAPAVAGVKSQYHAQDELGQASYGHAEPFQSHSAVQDAAGNKVGSFSYVRPDGQIHRTDYVADGLGYRVASNDLPVGPGVGPAPVVDTPEVVAARAAHLALHSRARRAIAVGHTPAATAPLTFAAAPVTYSAYHHSPYAYSSYVAPAVHSAVLPSSPYAYSSYVAPAVHSAAVVPSAPFAYAAAPAVPSVVREATLTTVVNNPGHAVSYRVD